MQKFSRAAGARRLYFYNTIPKFQTSEYLNDSMNSWLRRSPQRATTRNNTTTPTLIAAKVHYRSGLLPPGVNKGPAKYMFFLRLYNFNISRASSTHEFLEISVSESFWQGPRACGIPPSDRNHREGSLQTAVMLFLCISRYFLRAALSFAIWCSGNAIKE